MPELVDLTNVFGESWCVTVTDMPLDAALEFMGVVESVVRPNGLAEVTGRLVASSSRADRQTLLLGKETAGWTVVLELEGLIGWVGEEPGLLGDLSAGGGTACTMRSSPNEVAVIFAEDGEVTSGLNAVNGWRWGTPSPRLAAALDAVGFTEGAAAETEALSFAQCAALAVQAATGVELHADTFQDGWSGGLTEPRS
ncbi:DUF6461 domain-containing protein [Actinokineospora sp. NBRC 105648]|uniref:DUF6461 domain-containing protein n=1 Tax=Actinokineospora sp. NBRC 105648 TaxID=3032206 RepID=UPI0024A51BF3|nr:DUF6461 domain-containing protein [Actinokineospora sp. NBRC 105648]GLZ41807.1 hypothetical protein Acsp05_54310 [Actinokineospora sp. NBRC 105648]